MKSSAAKIVGTQYTLGTEKDFSPLIAQVAASKAKVLLFALKGDGLDFIRQADEQGLLKETTVAFLGLSEVDLGIFRGKGQNMYTVVPSVATSDDPAMKAFVAKARAEGGADVLVSNYVMTHYNTLVALKAAVEKAGKADKEAIIDALAGLTIAIANGACDDRQRSPRDDEHVHCEDKGQRSRHRPRAGSDCAAAGVQTGWPLSAATLLAVSPWRGAKARPS